MKIDKYTRQKGNGLVVVVSVIATVLTILGAAVSYTGHISRISQRSRRTALAVEIADGHLEYLFTNWRNIYRATALSYNSGSGGTNYALLPTNYFFTTMWNPGPAPSPVPYATSSATPAPIPLPSPGNFPTEANYNVTQYRIQAVDPMLSLDSNENALMETSFGSGNFTPMPKATPYPSPSTQIIPPAAYGQNTWQYSFYYLAAVDVSVPALGTNNGTVTAKVRRVFEKKFDNPWTYAMFYVHDLELQPTTTFQLDGRITTNGNLYIGNSSVTIVDNSTDQFPSTVTYGGQYVNGVSANDTYHSGSVTAPTFPQNEPPVQGAPYLPFGWNVNFSGSGGNNDSYHEIIETPVSGTDPLSQVRMYNQADYRVTIDQSNTITVTDYNGNTPSSTIVNDIKACLATNVAIQDNREGTYVRLTTLDVGALTTYVNNGTLVTGSNGNTGLVLYIKDTTTNGTSVTAKIGGTGSNVQTTERAIRLKNGATLPNSGLTIVSENPVYIQGDYNTGGAPPSDSGTYTSPTVSGYTRKPAAVYGDAINILSGNWNDLNSTLSTPNRVATNTTVNSALVTGEVPSSGGNYSGGGENFVRYLEDWTSKSFTYYGSMIELFNSVTATGPWKGTGTQYKQPGIHWYYDTKFSTSAPPGNIQIAAYLQQQRWYQVY
jgi:hypothetical protein